MPGEESEVGCPPVASNKKKGGVSVQKSDGTVEGSGEGITPPPTEPEPTGTPAVEATVAEAPAAEAPAAAEAPKRRGRPPKSPSNGNGRAKRPAAPAAGVGAAAALHKVKVSVRYQSRGPDGKRVDYSRVLVASAPTPQEAIDAVSAKFEKVHLGWQKIFAR